MIKTIPCAFWALLDLARISQNGGILVWGTRGISEVFHRTDLLCMNHSALVDNRLLISWGFRYHKLIMCMRNEMRLQSFERKHVIESYLSLMDSYPTPPDAQDAFWKRTSIRLYRGLNLSVVAIDYMKLNYKALDGRSVQFKLQLRD
jgi:hypothetical protein